MATLRSAHGCPWDLQQTPESLRPFLLEETYEALDAIDRGDFDALSGELGDVLFQCVFQAQLAVEAGRFDIADVVEGIRAKLVRRHPHVFRPSGRPLGPGRAATGRLASPDRVLEQWEAIKAREQAATGRPRRVLAGLPRTLPALLTAHEIGTRVAAVGFDWPRAADVLNKIEEEVGELRASCQKGEPPGRAAEELGDVLFSIVNLARKLGIEAESALRGANAKFSHRFAEVEALLESRGLSVHTASPAALEEAWAAVKTAAATPPAATPARARSSPSPRARRSRR
jgi:MazG family protein